MEAIKKLGIGPIILGCQVKFLREIFLREKITIYSETSSYKNKIGFVQQGILNEKEELCCEAQFTIGLFDLNNRKLISPTPEWLYAIGFVNKPI